MTQAELRAFERLCRRFEKYLKERLNFMLSFFILRQRFDVVQRGFAEHRTFLVCRVQPISVQREVARMKQESWKALLVFDADGFPVQDHAIGLVKLLQHFFKQWVPICLETGLPGQKQV